MAKTGQQPKRDPRREALISDNFGLVYALANQLKPKSRHRDLVEDLQGEGFKALVAAADGFDFDRGVEFSTYAHISIMREMRLFLARDAEFKKHEKQMPLQSRGDDVFTTEPPIDVTIDTPPDEHGLMLRNSVETAMECLCDKDKELIRLRYFDQLTLQEIGNLMGYTLQAADQNINRALAKMKEHVDPEVLNQKSAHSPAPKKPKPTTYSERLTDMLDKSGE